MANTLEARQERIWSDANAAPGNEKVRLRRMAARAADGDVGDFFTTSCPIVLEFEYEILTPGQRWSPSIVVYNHERVAIFNTAANRSEVNWNDDNFHCGLYRSVCRIPGNLLNDGRHEIDLHMILSDATCAHRVERALVFDVHESPNVRRGQWYGKWIGVVRPELRWETELLQPVRQGDEMK